MQWLRIHLPMQGTWVQSRVREDPTCCGATKPMRHNYWAYALEPVSHNYWACMPQLLKPARLEPTSHNYWSPWAWSPCSATREATSMRSPCTATKTQSSSKEKRKRRIVFKKWDLKTLMNCWWEGRLLKPLRRQTHSLIKLKMLIPCRAPQLHS